ncbi:hypothetical protein D3C73_1586880 [compost metagenome]
MRRLGFITDRGERFATELIATSQLRHPSVILRVVTVVTGIFDIFNDAPTAAELHGADTDHIHSRLKYLAVTLLDQNTRDATPSQITG